MKIVTFMFSLNHCATCRFEWGEDCRCGVLGAAGGRDVLYESATASKCRRQLSWVESERVAFSSPELAADNTPELFNLQETHTHSSYKVLYIVSC